MCKFCIFLCIASFFVLGACSPTLEKSDKLHPAIHGPAIVGNYPETPFRFYIPTTGERPMVWKAKDLPEGLSLNSDTGIITGTMPSRGSYQVLLTATNTQGSVEKELTLKSGDTLALTPPMGWNSWNTFADNISDSLVRQIADSMVATGMRDLGYQYINIDDFWQLPTRDEDGRIQVNREKFPNGIKAVADYVHDKGFKLGIYSDAADLTCGGVAGSYGYEEQDAKDFANWGVDLVKYDYCHAPEAKDSAVVRYSRMAEALKASGRSVVLSVCEWGIRDPWTWAASVGGRYWRTTWDIRNTWINDQYDNHHNSIMQILDINSVLDEYAGPGRWNDPDMLVVGIKNQEGTVVSHGDAKGCTNREYRSHMSLWCLMAAPLLSGNDVRNMDADTKRILLNPEILAINQDILGIQAKKIRDDGLLEIFLKPLADGSLAVGMLNRHDTDATEIKVTWAELGITGAHTVRDVWAQKDISSVDGSLSDKVQPHECKVMVLKKAS